MRARRTHERSHVPTTGQICPNRAKFLRNREQTSMATKTNQPAGGGLTSAGYLVPFITVTALFFIFGFITNLNMALVPHLKAIFTLPYAWAMLAESAFFLAYFVFASPTSKLIDRKSTRLNSSHLGI